MIKILHHKTEINNFQSYCRQNNLKSGFIPTMGALHKGHLSLLEQCKKNKEVSIVSIYVNPTQFNDPVDFQNYPHTLDSDLSMLSDAGCDYVYIPETTELYPEGTDKKIHLDLGAIENILEGRFRPGHFDGVVTIITKLFEMVKGPDFAYFGQKDYQQYLVIKKLVEYFKYPIKIYLCPILREDDGLAMSSRNMLLSHEERKIAPIIYKTLSESAELLKLKSIDEVKNHAKKILSSNDLVSFEYFEVLDAGSFLPVKALTGTRKFIICVALKIGKIRLIDNLIPN